MTFREEPGLHARQKAFAYASAFIFGKYGDNLNFTIRPVSHREPNDFSGVFAQPTFHV